MDPELARTIISSLGLDPNVMTEEERSSVLEKAGTLIYQGVLMKIIETLPDPDVNAFEKLIDGGAEQEQITTFLKSKVANFDDIVREEAGKFIKESRDTMSGL